MYYYTTRLSVKGRYDPCGPLSNKTWALFDCKSFVEIQPSILPEFPHWIYLFI